MAYLIGNDLKSGIVRPTLPRKPSLPGKPVGLRQPRLEDVDPDMADRLRYTQNVYGGDAAQTYKSHRAAIDAQYDYTLRRALTGKELVPVSDPAWSPSQYDDDTNDAIVLWYKQHGNTGPTQQNNPRVDAYELKINSNNESYYLKAPAGGYVQYENMVNDDVIDGKLVIQQKSFYHVNDLPDFARNKVLQEAMRQVEAANNVGYTVEWLISDPKAVAQLTDFFRINNINIVVKHFPE